MENNKKILVTGSAGFIGSHLVDTLLEKGYHVVGVDNLSLGRKENFIEALKSDHFSFVEANICNEDALDSIFKQNRFDVVFHLAANSDISQSHNNPNIDFDNTFMTTYCILMAMKKYDVKNIVFASSSAIYGDTGTKKIDENFAPLFPISHYGASKMAGEAFISSFVNNYKFKAWILRFPNVVGERATHGVIFDFIKKLKNNSSELEVLGDGEQNKPYLYVKDLIEAILFTFENSDENINYFNLGVDSRTKVKEIALMVIEAMKIKASIKYTGGSIGWVGDVPQFDYDLKKVHHLGWKAKLTSNEAIKTATQNILIFMEQGK